MAETRTRIDARMDEVRDDIQNREVSDIPDTGTRDLDTRDYEVRQSTYPAAQSMSDDPDRIEREMEQTRREMAETLGELQKRLDPERLKFEAEWRVEQAVARAKDEVEDATIGRVKEMTQRATEKASNWRSNMVHTIKENPVPAALVGVGLGWLIMESSGRNGEQYRYGQRTPDWRTQRRYDEYAYGGYGDYGREDSEPGQHTTGYRRQGMGQRVSERVEDAAEDVRERAQHLREEATERVSETTEEIRARAEHLRDEASEQFDELRDEARQRARHMQTRARNETMHAKRSMQHLMRENPLALGAAAMALGILVGWAAPATETESRLVGEYRDDFVEQARHEAENVAQKAQSAAKEVVEDVKEQTKTKAKEVASEVSEESKHATQRTGSNQTE